MADDQPYGDQDAARRMVQRTPTASEQADYQTFLKSNQPFGQPAGMDKALSDHADKIHPVKRR